MWFDKQFFNIKEKYLETARDMESPDTWFFQASIKNEDTVPE